MGTEQEQVGAVSGDEPDRRNPMGWDFATYQPVAGWGIHGANLKLDAVGVCIAPNGTNEHFRFTVESARQFANTLLDVLDGRVEPGSQTTVRYTA